MFDYRGLFNVCWLVWKCTDSSNKIGKAKNEHLNIVFQNLKVCTCEFITNFLTFLGLNHLLFDLDNGGKFEFMV